MPILCMNFNNGQRIIAFITGQHMGLSPSMKVSLNTHTYCNCFMFNLLLYISNSSDIVHLYTSVQFKFVLNLLLFTKNILGLITR